MPERPYTLLSAAVSIDGYLDGGPGHPLRLSSGADLDRVDALRSDCDAILVGARTVRNDNPRLLVRSAARRTARREYGRSPTPVKVTITRSGDLDPSACFFSTGREKLVYCASDAVSRTSDRLGAAATVIDCGQPADLGWLSADLCERGVRRLLVEGGRTTHTQFLTHDLADELHLVVAPFFVGGGPATRFLGDGQFPWHPGRRAPLAEVRQLDDVVLLRYALSARFDETQFGKAELGEV
jgi:5-amino-6-(5-phosphoribosylamino)uracil reductase